MGNLCYKSRYQQSDRNSEENKSILWETIFDNERQAKQENFADELKQQGHTCISYIETYPISIGWCRKTPCERSL